SRATANRISPIAWRFSATSRASAISMSPSGRTRCLPRPRSIEAHHAYVPARLRPGARHNAGGGSVGIAAAAMPNGDYKDLRCVAPKGKTVAGFADWRACDAGPDGVRMLH